MNLMSYTSNGGELGTHGGTFDASAANNPSINPGSNLFYVLGGVNLQGNPEFSIGNNGICLLTPLKKSSPGKMLIDKYQSRACKIQFESARSLVSRGLDPHNPDHWVIKGMLAEAPSLIRRN